MTPKEREQLTASLKYAQDALRDGRLPEGVRPSYQDQVAKLRMRLGLDAAPVTPPVVTGPAPTPTPSTSTTTAPEPPSGLEDRRLKIPPRYRAVWRVLYRWAGSSKRMDRVVVTNLATIARTLAPDWNGFSTRVVRSAIEYLSQQKGIGVIDVRREPQVVAQKSGWRRGPDGTFKEAPAEIHVPLTSALVLDDLVARLRKMPREARNGDPRHVERQRRYRQRQKKAATDPVTQPSADPVTER